MDRATEDRLLALAVARGDLRLEDIAQAEDAGPAGARLDCLVASGRLTAGAVDDLQAGVTRLFGSTIAARDSSAPRALSTMALLALADDLSAGLKVGRYEIVEPIGRGGMGQVYRAFDPSLARHVALKVLCTDSPELARRFFREAQAQARIDHPHVCQVFEVGEEGGRLYIAMQLIAGQTLGRAAPDLTLEQRVRVMETVAEAVHEAHRQGLIHRDIKPGNIMVERLPDGTPNPVVLDFGLALDQQAPGLTRTGVVMGTVQYMAPEQARGEVHAVDRRADVWSLGAVLYELASGVPPFQGSGEAEVLLKVMQQEVPPLRQRVPQVPPDLETIVMKCLEREPQRRYDSARALAEDLQRFLDGEPLIARPTSFLYRLRKRARKHRAAVATAAVSLVVLAGLVGVGVRGRLQAAERARLAQQFGQEVERMEGFLRNAYALPLHDVRPERALVRKRMESVAEQVHTLGRTAVGPGRYALGRGYLALGQPALAREHLEAAWQAGHRTPETAFALGQCLALLYRDALDEVQRISIKELREARKKALQATLRAPALRYLEASRGATLESTSLLEGLVALLDERFDQALASSDQAAREAPWLYEPHLVRGEVFMARALGMHERGDLAGCFANLAQAHDAFARAADMARSDPRVYEDLSRQAISVVGIERLRDTDLREAFEKAREATEQALQADPDDIVALRMQASAYYYWGEASLRRGTGHADALDTATALAERALHLDPHDATSLQTLGTVYMARALQVELRRGEDPRGSLDQATRYLSRALAENPSLVPAQVNRATCNAVRAEYEIARGLDPRPSLEAAATGLQSILAAGPMVMPLLNNLGNVYYRKGIWENGHGIDPRPSYTQVVRACEQAIAASSTFVQPYNLLGAAWAAVAKIQASHGIDPEPELQRALTAYEQALARNPQYALAVNNIGEAHLIRAGFLVARGENASAEIALSLGALQRVLTINPGFGEEVYMNIAAAHLLRARTELLAGRNPGPRLAEARAAARRALETNPRSYRGFADQASSDLLAARWAADHRLSPVASLDRAAGSLVRAIEINPGDAEGFEIGAAIAQQRASWLLLQGRDAHVALDAGLASVERGLTINPLSPVLLARRATLIWLASRGAASAETRREAARRAETAWQQALPLNPLLARELEPFRREATAAL
ncbi:MAG TPA: protein kinase [Thermoanaerobaculaceae bacterium]|nr:protein kinase [Thermoanaerobaculaceae bacterium]HPS77044.1 protein kinase [Thermoanaerobaculaceae bacterium]